MATVSVALGVFSLLGVFIGLIPCLGWLNWLNLGVAAVGAVLGLASLGDAAQKGAGALGMALCIAAACIGVIRLIIGGGVF